MEYCRKIENKFGKQIVIQKLLLYLHEFVFSYFGLLKLFFKEPSLCEKRWFCLTKKRNEIQGAINQIR